MYIFLDVVDCDDGGATYEEDTADVDITDHLEAVNKLHLHDTQQQGTCRSVLYMFVYTMYMYMDNVNMINPESFCFH